MSETIRLKASDGFELSAYVARPSGTPKRGLVVIQEIFGVNGHIRRVTDEFARDGFLAIAPALFDRIEPEIELAASKRLWMSRRRRTPLAASCSPPSANGRM